MNKQFSGTVGYAKLTPDHAAFRSYEGTGSELISLKSRSKLPLHANWTARRYDQAIVLADAIKSGRNLGVRLKEHQLVIDVDPRNGGTEGFANLCRDLGFNPDDFPHVITGSGGSHYYMRKPDDVLVADALPGYPGVEFKSKGRQVVAAGSIHPETGRHYEWAFDSPPLADAPMAPQALIDAIRRPESTGTGEGAGSATCDDIARALAGINPTDFRYHDKWLRLMMAVHHASGGAARNEFIAWCISDPRYAHAAEEIGRRWDSLHREMTGGITVATLNQFLRDAGRPDLTIAGDAAEDFDGEPIEDREPEPDGLSASLASDIEPEAIRWLWVNRFAVGKLSIVAGYPDAGKSQITINMAATVSNGGKWPNGEGRAERGSTLYLSSEDDAADTIVPRLKAAGADLSQVSVVSSIVTIDGKSRVFNLADDLGRLSKLIGEERAAGRNVRLVIIDPISAYMGGSKKGDTFKNTDVRAMLTPLTEWAAKHEVAVVAISHFNKAGNSHAVYRVTDSVAFTAAARSVWLTATDESGQKMMLKGKNNIGPDPGGLSYSIEGVDIGKGINAPRIVWGEPVTVTADEVLNARKERGPSAMDEAMLWLESYLSDGARPQKEVMEAAQHVGHSAITIKRAKRDLGVESVKGDFGDGWQWRLPVHEEDR